MAGILGEVRTRQSYSWGENMSLYARNRYESGVKRSTFQAVLLVAGLLALICIYLVFRLTIASTSDTQLRDVFIERAQQEEQLARENASQMSRIGGTNTWQLLARTRQHLYALTQINELFSSLVASNQQVVPQSAISSALNALTDCETQILAGNAIDEQLSVLWDALNVIAEAASALTT